MKQDSGTKRGKQEKRGDRHLDSFNLDLSSMFPKRLPQRPPKIPRHGQTTVPHPITKLGKCRNQSRSSKSSSITSGRSMQSSARSYHDDKRVTRAKPKCTNPPTTEENSYHMISSLGKRVKKLKRELAQITKLIAEISQHSSTSSSTSTSTRVCDSPLHYLLTILDIDTTSACSFGFITAQDIMEYGSNNTQELFHMFHRKDLENEQLVVSLLKIKATGHILNHLLEQGHNSIPKAIMKRVQRHPHNDTALDKYITAITGEKTFPVFRALFIRHYHQERKMFYTLLEHIKYQADNYPSSIANSSPSSSTVTPAPRHHTSSVRSLRPSKDERFAFPPKPNLRSHIIEPVPTLTRGSTTYDKDDLIHKQPLDSRQHASLNRMRNINLDSARFAPTPKRSRPKLAHSSYPNVNTSSNPIPSLGIPDEYDVSVEQMCQHMRISVDMWKSLPMQAKTWLIKERTRLLKECSSNNKNHSTRTNPTNEKKPAPTTVSSSSKHITTPRQYHPNTASKVVTDSHDSSVSLDVIDLSLYKSQENEIFRRLKLGEKLPESSQQIPYHMVFNDKLNQGRRAFPPPD